MSRIGKKYIYIPENVKVTIIENKISVKGILGSFNQIIPNQLQLRLQKNQLLVCRNKEDKKSKSLHGLYRVLINNMMIGVTYGFFKKLELVGVGYKANYNDKEKILDLNLGFSHNIMLQLPEEIDIEIESEKGKNYIIILKSHDKQLLGIVSEKIRSFRKPEPYKGKGVRYFGEIIRRKSGKSA
ncbi:50S ribosomal protein L6 [Blattabacterium cuenoti]|uniref:50S ribosomal protein L6 n=1 Tax=Blattabacterium cuenoti TaxID=1653831 RepID=UPI00163BF820|nr:50S ribosomal protein L6 [Blattabacterium cuenoti]